MLDILRKHASSWVIKVVLGAIVISFIFFFGYNSMRSGNRGGKDAVASVNGSPISVAEYKFILDNNFERLKQSFTGAELPDFVVKMARSQTLRQLVSRQIGLQLAADLGVVVPDEALAAVVVKTPYAQRDGEFDPIFYRQQFLPYFKQRFGLDFEDFLKSDIELETVESIFATVDKGVPTAKDDGKGDMAFSWTFETVAFDPGKLVRDGKVKSEDEVMTAAKLLVTSDPKKWKGLIAPFGLKVEKSEPITVKDRRRLLNGKGSMDDMIKIFSLTSEQPVLQEPIANDGKIYVVRLVEREETGPSDAFWPARDFFSSWMTKLSEKAKVVSYLKEEQ